MKRFMLFLFSLIPLFWGMWAATQQFARRVSYDPEFLGEPSTFFSWLFSTPSYAPWRIWGWYKMYNPYAPELFQGCFLYIFGGLIVTVLILYCCRPTVPLTSHGSAHWANYSDVLKMDLIASHGCVIGMYDPSWKQGLTSILRSLENLKKEKVSFAEMAYDRRKEKRIDKAIEALPKLRAKLESIPESNKALREKIKQRIFVTEKFLDAPPEYKAKRDNYLTVYPYVFVYNMFFRMYSWIPHFYLRDNSNKHLAVIAPTRSGKGVGLIVPTLLGGWTESCIVNDIKSENWGITAGYRKRMGQKVIKFEPTSDDGSTARWNPLDEIPIGSPMEVSMAQNLASIIANYEGKANPDHWIANAGNVIMAVILHLKYAHFADPERYPHAPNLYTVASFLKANTMPIEESEEPDSDTDDSDEVFDDDNDVKEVNVSGDGDSEEEPSKGSLPGDIDIAGFTQTIKALLNFQHIPEDGLKIKEWDTKQRKYIERTFTRADLRKVYPDADSLNLKEYAGTHPIIMQAFAEIASKPDQELGSIISTANTALKEYLDPLLAKNTSVSDFCIDDMMNYKKPVTLYLVTPPSDILRLAPIFRLFFEMMVRHHARKIGTYENGQAKTIYKHKCLFLMDEFSSLGNLKSFAATLSYIAGYGMKVFLINQGLPQINGIYGKDNQILMNCHLQIFYAPNDNDTGKYAEQLLGNKTITVESISDNSQGGMFGKKSVSRSQTGRALMTSDELKRLGDQEIIVASGSPPVLTEKIKYYQDKFFTMKLKDAPVVSDVIRTDPVMNANPDRDELLRQQKALSKKDFNIRFKYKTASDHEKERSEKNAR